MAASLKLEKFHETHPYPDQLGINSLFKFYKIEKVKYLKHLFVEKKLHHSLPSQFNDPFECKPHFSFPKEAEKLLAIKKHWIKLFMGKGFTRRVAEEKVSTIMENPKVFQRNIIDAVQKGYAALRICSFTTEKENLLFWSHYTDSHKGFCVEFDATEMPISYAFKVDYKDEYPEVIYPIPKDATGFIPALVKSKDWKKEKEFRTIFYPGAPDQPDNDGESLILNGNEIKKVYLGSQIIEENKELIVNLIEKGDFNPDILTTSLDESSFKLKFTLYR